VSKPTGKGEDRGYGPGDEGGRELAHDEAVGRRLLVARDGLIRRPPATQ